MLKQQVAMRQFLKVGRDSWKDQKSLESIKIAFLNRKRNMVKVCSFMVN